ncbi:hypothetical protein F0562_009388 [Nyssa sinensis]|uniref:Uncharacterized protein n=1 Tax=Nyssa sinensis TaxID=561372 RepID=A0A5J4ZW03_9ASTE|nr:hypothetical protein F0562_009388 [Nyssa sinensis]
MTVLVMWVTSAEITQGIFEDYKHPFAMAYLGTSLLVLHLPIAFIKNWFYHLMRCHSCESSNKADIMDKSYVGLESPVKIDGVKEAFEVEHKESSTGKEDRKLTTKEIASLGFLIAPIWFLTEYLTNAALARTNVASTTVLSSTSGLFTLFIGAFLGQDSIYVAKVVSVIVSMAGVAISTLGKTWSTGGSQLSKSTNEKQSIVGDLFAILSAMTYALFTVLLKKFTGEEGEKVDMQKLYGYIGLFTLVFLWWLIQYGLLLRWVSNLNSQSLTLLKWKDFFLPTALLEVFSVTIFGH